MRRGVAGHGRAADSPLLARWRVGGLALAASAALAVHGAEAAEVPTTIRLAPATVRMGAFYSGATVRIEGTAAPGTQVVVVVRGPELADLFNRKDRIGPVWVNVDRVHVARVPSSFVRLGGGDLRSLLDRTSIDAYRLDEAAIRSRMICRSRCRCGASGATRCTTGVEPDGRYADLIRDSYLALKAREGCYRVLPDAVRVVDSTGGVLRYVAELEWPRNARPGAYEVEALACRDRSVAARASALLRVEEVGFPARVRALARTHSAVYGAAAVLAAVIGGCAIDALARLRRRGHRGGRGAKAPPTATRAPDSVEMPSEDQSPELVGSRDIQRPR